MDKTYVDARALKQYIATDGSIISTNQGYLIKVQTVLDDIDFVMANYAVNVVESPINIKKWRRILDRNKKELQRLKDNEENLSEWGKHDLGYFKGRVSVLEDLFDELGIEVEE